MKSKWISAGLFLLAVSFIVPGVVLANEGQCARGGKGGHEGGYFSHMAGTVLKAQDELGLSKEQAQAIRDLKLDVSKNLTLQGAAVKNAEADVRAQMHNDKVDLAAVQKLIDQKYELKKTEEKTSVEGIVKLKSLLTEQQLTALKKIKKEHKGHAFWKKEKSGADAKEDGQDK